MSEFCKECNTRRAAVTIAASEHARLTRRAVRNQSGKNVQAVSDAKVQRDRAREALRVHESECEVIV